MTAPLLVVIGFIGLCLVWLLWRVHVSWAASGAPGFLMPTAVFVVAALISGLVLLVGVVRWLTS